MFHVPCQVKRIGENTENNEQVTGLQSSEITLDLNKLDKLFEVRRRVTGVDD